MEPNGLFPNINNGFLGVENPNPLKQQQQQQQQPNLQNQHTLHHPQQMVSYSTHHEITDTHPQHQSFKHGYPNNPYSSNKTNNNKSQTTLSDEDEPGFADDQDPKRKGSSSSSPWHRMKWTDTMVRLLIMAVYYIGDEAGCSEAATPTTTTDTIAKKKATGLIQKKGKWKSVSIGMMEKGYYVSPQQCEDKFNDLNKRYKRVNDILGKGTACRVVENQSLLDTMDLSPKMKEEARKLLNSKHLFFREMCAYHNSCGHGSSTTCNNMQQQSSEAGTETQPQQQQQQQHQHQKCLHSSEMLKGRTEGEEEEEEDDDEWEDYSEDEEEDESGEGSKGQMEEDENDNVVRKRLRKVSSSVSLSLSSEVMMQQLSSEVMSVMQDGVKSGLEKKQWMKKKVVQLGEQQVSYQVEALEMEKQRLKWVRFSSKREREMERDKLENQKRRLEIERMVLMLRQKELELISTNTQQQQHSST